MAYWSLAVFLVVVTTMTVMSMRGRRAVQSCCAPSDATHDLRMRAAFDSDA